MHKDCLLDSFRSRGDWFDLDCPQCKQAYYGQAGVDLATFALSQVQEEDGEDSVAFAAALFNLASAFFRVGDYQKQKEVLERVRTTSFKKRYDSESKHSR